MKLFHFNSFEMIINYILKLLLVTVIFDHYTKRKAYCYCVAIVYSFKNFTDAKTFCATFSPN